MCATCRARSSHNSRAGKLDDAEKTIASLRAVNKMLETRLRSASPGPDAPGAGEALLAAERDRLVDANRDLVQSNDALKAAKADLEAQLTALQGLPAPFFVLVVAPAPHPPTACRPTRCSCQARCVLCAGGGDQPLSL